MKVKIIACQFKDRWYSNRIGEVFEVVKELTGTLNGMYEVKGPRSPKWIRKENVEIVQEEGVVK